jgi:hypothetical protein|nr:hypothetical protein [Kofleriaceae bacterium]
MSYEIHNWLDGYLAARDRAYDTRGAVELDFGVRWPRTTGADVVAVAALVDPAITKHGTPGIIRRWRATRGDLERDALGAANLTYPENRTFWASVEAAVVFLDDVSVSPPAPKIWKALLDELGSTLRNADGGADIVHFDTAKTYDELLEAQRAFLANKRGSDVLPPPAGFGGWAAAVPHTTNADVLQLATYWTGRLTGVKHEMGHDGIVKMWQVAFDDVDKLAKPGKPDDVYPKNHEFWASARRVAVQVAISDEAPSKWDMFVGSVKDSVSHLPDRVEHAVEGAAHVIENAGKSVLESLGAPVLIGAGLLGLFLISRTSKHEET